MPEVQLKTRKQTVEEFEVGQFYMTERGHGFKILRIEPGGLIVGLNGYAANDQIKWRVRSMIDGAISVYTYDKNKQFERVLEVNGRKVGVPS